MVVDDQDCVVGLINVCDSLSECSITLDESMPVHIAKASIDWRSAVVK